MSTTVLHYLIDMNCMELDARVIEVVTADAGEVRVVLDQTAFYPRGGGQPSDVGSIECPRGAMSVREVAISGGVAVHVGEMIRGRLQAGEMVNVRIDAARRLHHSRLHSAGEVICAAVRKSGFDWLVSSAMHYPGSSKIVYDASLPPEQREALASELARAVDAHVEERQPILISSTTDRGEVLAACGYDPSYIAPGEPVRIVNVGKRFSRPCMGTHVGSTAEIGKIIIRNVKSKKGQTSIGYDLEENSAHATSDE